MPAQDEGMRLAQALADVMGALTKVMEDEMFCLARNDAAGLQTLYEKKTRLFRDCQINASTLTQKPELLGGLPRDVRKHLRVTRERMNEVGRRNTTAFQGAIKATEALIQTVVDAARKGTKLTDCYSDPRKTPLLLGSYSPICESVAYRRTA